MSQEIDAVNWDDTPFITLNVADVDNLREHESNALDTILTKAGRSRSRRNGVDTCNALVIPISDPLYATFRTMLENRRNPETDEPGLHQLHWYLVSWKDSTGMHGTTEIDFSLPWAAGDMQLAIDGIQRANPTACGLSIVGVMEIDPPRKV